MKNKRIGNALSLLIIGGALLLSSCQNDKTVQKQVKGSTLSLDSFFNSEIEKLTKLNPTVEKNGH